MAAVGDRSLMLLSSIWQLNRFTRAGLLPLSFSWKLLRVFLSSGTFIDFLHSGGISRNFSSIVNDDVDGEAKASLCGDCKGVVGG